MTKREYFMQIRSLVADNAELVAFIDHEISLLEKKNAKRSDKLTKKQADNALLIESIYAEMESGKGYTVSDLTESVPALSGLSVQKVSALITAMRKNLMVTRDVVKGKAYFYKV